MDEDPTIYRPARISGEIGIVKYALCAGLLVLGFLLYKRLKN